MRGRLGFTLIELMIVIAIIAIIASIAIPSLLSARKHGQEASAIASLRTVNTQEVLFRDGDKEQDGNQDYGMLSELSNTGLIDSVLGSGTKQGYLFQAGYSFTTSEFLWFAVANPALPGSTGDRYFEVATAGVIYYTTGKTLPMDTSTCLAPNAANPATPIK
ncbi:prepilin-type N-terminal cleavage/methylation domain-containing protein [bacterium]|nr:prepilin-type N-terminal cleavage/methylation domain-containing protein [bacterium]